MVLPAFTDICCNLTHASFKKDTAEVLTRAQAAGVKTLVVPGTSISDSERAINLANQAPAMLLPTVGIHPHMAKEWRPDSREQLLRLAQNEAVVAIGETGLDYCRNFSPPDQQIAAFKKQLGVAKETGLPLLLHQRDAHEDFIAILRATEIKAAVIHCFTGSRDELDAYLELDLYIGITGWICDERRGRHLEELLSAIPPDRLLIETDAPYLLPRDLAPESRPRNRRNEPAFLVHVGKRIADALGIPIDELAYRTNSNAHLLFGKTAEPNLGDAHSRDESPFSRRATQLGRSRFEGG